MTLILYYSRKCANCNELLHALSKSPKLSNLIHFVCVDKVVVRPTGHRYAVLDNGQEMLLPPVVQQVPAMLLLHDQYRVLFGQEVMAYLQSILDQERRQATQHYMEPHAYSFVGGGGAGGSVVSDQFSYLDQSVEDLSGGGNGGMRQLHHYQPANDMQMPMIQAPPVPTMQPQAQPQPQPSHPGMAPEGGGGGGGRLNEEVKNKMIEDALTQYKQARDLDAAAWKPPMPQY